MGDEVEYGEVWWLQLNSIVMERWKSLSWRLVTVCWWKITKIKVVQENWKATFDVAVEVEEHVKKFTAIFH